MAKTNVPIVLYEDEAIVVVSKPPLFHTLPDRFRYNLPNLRHWLERRYEKIFIVHRLDHDTSGILIATKTADAHRQLSLQFEHHSVDKIYHAVVVGVVQEEQISIDIPLLDDPRRAGRIIPSVRGKESLTHVRVLERFRAATLIECKPITGRQHQIRVHLAAIGHPLLVDPLYGVGDGFYLSGLKPHYKKANNRTEKPIISRATLHAYSVTLLHPLTHRECVFMADYPKDFRALLRVLRKYSPSAQVVFSL